MSGQDFYGVKRVTAYPATRLQDNMDRSPNATIYVPADDPGPHHGYTVIYADGYRSWSPKETFEAAYKPITAMGFEGALAAMKAGHAVKRDELGFGPRITKENLADWDLGTSDIFAEDWTIVE